MGQELIKEINFNEVFDSQWCFRILTDSMSKPGRLFRLEQYIFPGAPEGFNPGMLTVLKTLGDNTVSFSAGNYHNNVHRYVELNTGMQLAEIEHADYILFRGTEYDQSFCAVNEGSLEFPEDSATVIIAVKRVFRGQQPENGSCGSPCCSGEQLVLHMTGPGIKDMNRVSVTGFDALYLSNLADKNAIFPLGIDMIIVDEEGNIICIPRTTKVEVA